MITFTMTLTGICRRAQSQQALHLLQTQAILARYTPENHAHKLLSGTSACVVKLLAVYRVLSSLPFKLFQL
jgi:hypothetical protein